MNKASSIIYPVRTAGDFGDMEIGYLDEKGRIQFRVRAESACGHYDGLGAIKRKGKVEVIHDHGKVVFRTSADYASGPFFGHFVGSVARDEFESDYGLLTAKGKWRIKPEFYNLGYWDGKHFSAKREMFGECSLYRATGKLVLEDYALVGGLVSEDLVCASLPKDKKLRQGFRKLDGEWQIKPRFDSVTQFFNGRAFAVEGLGAKRKAGIIGRDGEWLRVFPKKVESFCDEISEGVVGVHQGKTCGLMNLDGDLLCEGAWNLMDRKVVGGVIPVRDTKSKKYGLLDTAGDWRLKPQFDEPAHQVGPFVTFYRKTNRLHDVMVVANTAGEIIWDGPSAA